MALVNRVTRRIMMRQRSSMCNIKDIAERAQVSTCTVSRYLNHKIRLTPDTEARVRAAIDELGYVPSGIAKSLKTNETKKKTKKQIQT